jgi:hypothetical protein
MNQTGVTHKHFVVQGKIANLYRYPCRFNITLKKRITKHIKDLELPVSGYTVHRLAWYDPRRRQHIDNDEAVDFLQKLHHQVQAQFRQRQQQNQQQLQYYYKLTYHEFSERAAWVIKVASARKVLPKGVLGEKKLTAVLQKFLNEQAFRQAYDDAATGGGQAAMVERLASLQMANGNANRRQHIFSRSNAEAICAHLVSVTTTATATTTTTTTTTTPTKKATTTRSVQRTKPAATAPKRDTRTKVTAAAKKSAIVTPERDSRATDREPTADGTTAQAALFVD